MDATSTLSRKQYVLSFGPHDDDSQGASDDEEMHMVFRKGMGERHYKAVGKHCKAQRTSWVSIRFFFLSFFFCKKMAPFEEKEKEKKISLAR